LIQIRFTTLQVRFNYDRYEIEIPKSDFSGEVDMFD
jgi:hypothetical protein